MLDLSTGAVVFVGDGKGGDALELFNDKLSDLRRKLFREATDFLKKNVLKGTRWILLTGQENLDDEQDEVTKLQEALKLNEPLAVVY